MKTTLKTIAFSLCFLTAFACKKVEKQPQNTNANLIAENTKKPNKQFIKVALLLDTSNSMDGLIDQAKAQLWEIVNELSYAKCNDEKPNLQIALYEYGNDNLNGEEGYIRQVLNFSDDLDDISKELFSLTTNGGQEYCGYVINSSLKQLSWGNNPDDLKLIFIAGNEPFTQGSISYKDATKLANTSDVTVNTIFCGDYNQGIATYWKEGADLTNGDYMAINHNQKTTYVESPYDDELLRLNKKLNKTYVAYGNLGSTKMALQSQQDSRAETYSKANAVKRTVSKSSHLYKNSKWDLVDALENEKVAIEEIEETQLPKDLKGKSEAEIKQIVSEKSEERKRIQKEIQKLNQKRNEYIIKEQKQSTNALENAMLKAIKSQAKRKNYKFKKS